MDMTDLYQEKILAFARAARASTRLTSPMASAEVKNPSCGDLVSIDLNYDENGIITHIGAHAEGCALCEAGTGFLLTLAIGSATKDIHTMSDQLTSWLKKEHDHLLADDQHALSPVRDFTSRHHCVSLSFEAAAKAISNA